MEVNGQPGEKWASDAANDKGAGDVQGNAEVGNERVTERKLLQIYFQGFFRRSPGK